MEAAQKERQLLNETFAENLRWLMKEKNIRPEQVGIAAGLSLRHVYRLMSGDSVPMLATAIMVAEALKETVDSLMSL